MWFSFIALDYYITGRVINAIEYNFTGPEKPDAKFLLCSILQTILAPMYPARTGEPHRPHGLFFSRKYEYLYVTSSLTTSSLTTLISYNPISYNLVSYNLISYNLFSYNLFAYNLLYDKKFLLSTRNELLFACFTENSHNLHYTSSTHFTDHTRP